MIRIVIVEDMALLLGALTNTINGQEDMRVVGSAVNADDALALCRELAPDLALIDVVTDGKANGITAAAAIRKELPNIKVVIMTALPEITFMESARKAGVQSFIYKDSDSEYLLFVLRSTMKGKGTYPGPSDEAIARARFTDSEMAVIRLVCKGKDRQEIAETLDITESRVKQHFAALLDKTGFDSITKFSVYAVTHGFIVSDHSD